MVEDIQKYAKVVDTQMKEWLQAQIDSSDKTPFFRANYIYFFAVPSFYRGESERLRP